MNKMKNLNVIMILIDGARLDHVQKSDYYQKLKSDNPHIQGFYFTFYPSGAVSGDHFF